ncbi:MAG: methylated-DNA--[protein]-cysteine S-methyltransferase [Bacteroidia bacterium]|nr:methylated-DNA--[protein]-cysteine S-methyltransferase [Bacteroidia bacterium]
MRYRGKLYSEYILEALAILEKQPLLRNHLDEVAKIMQVSPQVFHRMFIDWCGVGPRDFLLYTTPEYAHYRLKEKTQQRSLFSHPLDNRIDFKHAPISIIQMSEEEALDSNLLITYSMAESPFGSLFIASSAKGLCYMVFSTNPQTEITVLKELFPNAQLKEESVSLHNNAFSAFFPHKATSALIPLHLKGTDFQIKVWNALLQIPFGSLTTYQIIARQIGSPRSSRAVGTAVGNNPITMLVPCHRVVRSSGEYGNYMWGSERKLALIGWEAIHAVGSNNSMRVSE